MSEVINQDKRYDFSVYGVGTDELDIHIVREKAHGRKTERIYIKSNKIEWLDPKFKHAKCVIKVISNTTVHDNSVRYFVSSLDLSIDRLAQIVSLSGRI